MAGCQLGVDGGQAIIAAIGSDRDKFRLLDLDLANNSLGPGCGGLLAAALRRNETLTRLSLRWVTASFPCRSIDISTKLTLCLRRALRGYRAPIDGTFLLAFDNIKRKLSATNRLDVFKDRVVYFACYMYVSP